MNTHPDRPDKAEEYLRWYASFALIILTAAASTIALVWVWRGFPDRLDHPDFWLRAWAVTGVVVVVSVPIIWVLMRGRPKGLDTEVLPRPANWWEPVLQSGWGGIFLRMADLDRREGRGLVAGLVGLLAAALLFTVVRGSVDFVRGPRSLVPSGKDWILILGWMWLIMVWSVRGPSLGPASMNAAFVLVPMTITAVTLLIAKRRA